MLERVIQAYNEAVYDTDQARALKIVRQAIVDGASPEEIVFQVVVPAIDLMIETLDREGGASLAQHFMTAQIADAVTTEMVAKFRTTPEVAGRIVIGTSWGDFHGLGKKIVAGCMKALMIEVVDLGLNVTPERFVDEAVARDAQVIAISSMMLHTALGENGCLQVRRILSERGMEERFRVIVGGAPYRHDPELYKMVRADAWAENGIAAARVVAGLIREVRP